MKLRFGSAIVLCLLVAFSTVVATAQETHPPHAAIVPPPHQTMGNQEVSVRQKLEPVTPAATWANTTNKPPTCVGAMLLLSDGRVFAHSESNSNSCTAGGDYQTWYALTPDSTGSYVNGTWSTLAKTPGSYSPLFFGSAVLPDGKVVIQGGEYNCPSGSCSSDWQNPGALYDPAANTWTSTTAPYTHIGDAQSVVLPSGTWMLAECCALAFGDNTIANYAWFNESTLNFTAKQNSSDGKYDDFDEEGWQLLPSGQILTVDAYTSCTSSACTSAGNNGTNSELYNPSTNTWASAGSTVNQLWDSNCNAGGGSFEEGPMVLLPNGTVWGTGASDCRAGHTAVYTLSSGTWAAGPDIPSSNAANDAPASVEINGNAILMASPFSGTFSTPSQFYEWNGSTLSSFPNPGNVANTSSYQGHLLVLPTGQVMYTDYTNQPQILTSAGTYNSAWQPTVSSVSSTTLTPGTTYTVSGTQFNGLSNGASYGDDYQDATNYPLVRIVNTSTGNVVYCKTHGWSVGVGTGSTTVSTSFDVPSTIGTGASTLYVVANGIPSAGTAVTVGAGSPDFTISASPSSVSVQQGSSGNSTITTAVSGGFNSAIALSASGQPSGVTVTFNPTSIPAPGNGSSTMTMMVASTVATGTYTITVTGTGGGKTHTTTVTLTVTSAAQPDFSISASPTAITVAPGKSGHSTISTTALNGFNSAITLSASGQGSRVTVSFSPNPIAAPGTGTSKMTVKVGAKATAGTRTITVTGTGGGKTHTVTVKLTIS